MKLSGSGDSEALEADEEALDYSEMTELIKKRVICQASSHV